MRPARPKPIEFDCTTCGYVLRPHRDLAGRIVACPACEARLIVPEATPADPTPAVQMMPTIADLFHHPAFRWAN